MYKYALCSELKDEEWREKDDAPEWIEIIPAGPEIKGIDGRNWKLTKPQEIVKQQQFPTSRRQCFLVRE